MLLAAAESLRHKTLDQYIVAMPRRQDGQPNRPNKVQTQWFKIHQICIKRVQSLFKIAFAGQVS